MIVLFVNIRANNGKHISAYGELKALFLFVQFDDDSTTHSESWPYDTLKLPEWCSDFADGDKDSIGRQFNISQYFTEMSFGKLSLIGDVYPGVIRPKHNQDYYKNIGEVNSEILLSVDSLIDYSKYDNWAVASSGNYFNQPDGIVDLIFIIYRNFSNRLFFNQGWTGSAHFYLPNDIKTNDDVMIKKGRMNSGIQLRGGRHGFNYTVYTAAHELGHFLFGSGHIEGVTNLALMTGGPVWNASRGMHSWEKAKLGWIEFKIADTSGVKTYSLRDYMTTGDALKITVGSSEYYVIENREKISRHDKAGDKGIYVYHVTDRGISVPRVTVLCADGNWNFTINSDSLRLEKQNPDPLGESEMSFNKLVKGTGYSCNNQVYKDNSAWGDNTDAYDTSYNNVLSPVSNPPISNRSGIPFAIEIINENNGVYKLKIMFDDIYSGRPSKPRGLYAETDSLNHIKLSWLPNKEPDLVKYYIYRSHDSGKLVVVDSLIATVNDSLCSWTDIDPISHYNLVKYSTSAVDASGQESIKSAACEIRFDSSRRIIITNHEYD